MTVSIVVRKYGFGNSSNVICYTDDGHPAVFHDPADAELLRAQLAERAPNAKFSVIDPTVIAP